MMMVDLPLAREFPVATEAQWRALVATVLKGGDFDARLVGRTYDGLRIAPLSPPARTAQPIPRAGAGTPWGIAARVDHPDAAAAADLALADLTGGADTLVLVGNGARTARGFGFDLTSADTLDRALGSVLIDLIQIRLEPSAVGTYDAAAATAAVAARRGFAPAALRIDFGFDPLARCLATGEDGVDDAMTACIQRLRGDGFAGPFITCDARAVHEAGGSEAQELSVAAAVAVAAIRQLTSGPTAVPIDQAFRALSYTLAIDADQLLGIAKLRALRRLMARIETACGSSPQPIAIHAETAWRMQTRRDPAVSMVRAAMAVFAAGVGGADSIAVLPHTAALGLPDALARRIARNTQLVALEEAGLAHVADPAAGSGSIEALTDDLARGAWGLFQEIEREGGIVDALRRGTVQARVAETSAARMRDVATRRVAITGTSEFPNLAEPVAVVLPIEPVRPKIAAAAALVPLPSLRLAEPWETLRDRSNAHTAATGTRPAVFVAALGLRAEHGARTMWVVNAIAAGGIAATVPEDGFMSSSDVGRAFAASGSSVACITGTDATYGEVAEATAAVLKAAGARSVWLAGKPGAAEASLRASGVDAFLFAGQDLIAQLERLRGQLTANMHDDGRSAIVSTSGKHGSEASDD